MTSPLDCSIKLDMESGNLLDNPSNYRKLVGKLNFLVHTRPDIAFAVQLLSQFMAFPRDNHMTAAIHVLKYLAKDVSQGILLNNKSSFQLEGFCDADWAACPQTRRSVSGYIVFLGGSLISWKSKKQQTVSLSSAEAEYRSLRRLTAELAWLSRLLKELEVPNIQAIPVKCDSQAAIHIAKNPVFHERTKHIDLDCHFVREKLLEGLISLSYVPTKQQPADFFTKSLSGPQHKQLQDKLGLYFTPSNLRGGGGVRI
ncbi:secreted RxLR effector protein 161-like [Silene latifolia]|uniref:secreted RxLR effector protein 161-like n=1 Tax=Silene latifolia TaxID=37657 RepID=UPI003D78B278